MSLVVVTSNILRTQSLCRRETDSARSPRDKYKLSGPMPR
jgi:hypothetical protein